MKTSLRFIAVLGLFLLIVSFRTDTPPLLPPPSVPTIFEHLESPAVREITLEMDFKTYIRNKRTEEYQPAKLLVKQTDGTTETWDIEVRPRGKMRREVCDIPSMKLRFSEEQLAERGLDTRRTLKMVNTCRNSKGFDQLLLREYLAYRIYNLLTDYSYRVQLVKIKYVSSSGRAPDESYAFILEHRKDLGDRLDATVLADKRVGSNAMGKAECELFTLFQFMIGNTDWYYPSNHNVDLCGQSGGETFIPIPYDFDYSGFVNAPYAVADERLKLRDVTVRYYQGRCRPPEETSETIQLFLDKKPDIMQLVADFSYLDKRSRKHVNKYLKAFYAVVENPKNWEKAISEHCDRWPVPE